MYRVSKQPGISDDNRLYKRHRKRICSPSAFPIDLTIAEFLIGTIYSLLAENHMPQELHHAPTRRIVLVGIDNPLPESDIVLARPLEDLLARHGELSTARGADFFRFRQKLLLGHCCPGRGSRRVQRRSTRPVEDLRPDLLSDVAVETVGGPAARVPVAAKVDVAVALNEIELESAHGCYVIVERGVDVPGHEEAGAVGMEEGDGGGEGVVVVDQVGEVGHGLVAFVQRGGELLGVCDGCFGGVDGVDCALPAVGGC